jgi:hypothetical protein
LAQDGDLRQRLARQSAAKISTFSANRMIDDTMAIYESVVTRMVDRQ